MKRKWISGILLVAMLLMLTACSLPIDLPGGAETLICRVTGKAERLLTVEVLEDNLHYDAGATLLVQYRALSAARRCSASC